MENYSMANDAGPPNAEDPGSSYLSSNVSERADSQQLCASCDRCRSRKTKCDGKRPCSNCIFKFLKKNKLESIEGIDPELVECTYSPAKRRGPTPGRSSSAAAEDMRNNISSNHHSSSMSQSMGGGGMPSSMLSDRGEWPSSSSATFNPNDVLLTAVGSGGSLQQQQLTAALMLGSGSGGLGGGGGTTNNNNMQQQYNLLQQQLQQRQQQLTQQLQQQYSLPSTSGSSNLSGSDVLAGEPTTQRRRVELSSFGGGSAKPPENMVPPTLLSHTHMLDRDDPEGSRLRAYYKLSIDEMFRLPSTPSDEEYCATTGQPLAGRQLAALSAVRFAETALGAIVNNEVTLATELCNAVVHCLREAVHDMVDTPPPLLFEVAKAYFLLGVFRSIRGDMARYFKYRRVAITYLSKLTDNTKTQSLMAAISFLDAWAYMMYNGSERDVPDVDSTIPPVAPGRGPSLTSRNDPVEEKYGIKTDLCSITSDPKNKHWIQGAPPVFLNNEAPLHSRVLDAVSCAVRTCCDFANTRFATIAKESITEGDDTFSDFEAPIVTPTSTAVMAHEEELCSRNVILSAFSLMQQDEANKRGYGKNEGQHLIISAMDAFLENGDSDIDGGFTDNQIQSLLSVCNSALENPLLLYHAGPTYHMVTNAATLLCHLLNGMHVMKKKKPFGPMEATMFEEVFDTLVAIRKLLMIHRRKLPVRLRCHELPRIPFDGGASLDEEQPFIDLGETLLCCCRGCQGFVLMACSPCVAAERAKAAAGRLDIVVAQENEAVELGELSDLQEDFGSEFDLDDDALLTLFGSLINA